MKDSVRLLESFEDSDRVAVLLIDRGRNQTRQSFATIETARGERFQRALAQRNLAGYDVYLGMNPLKEGSTGRTKADIAAIRHLYLDCDDRGDEIVERVLNDGRAPAPHALVQTSERKWQILWKVFGFDIASAEDVLHGLVHGYGADPAATDATRVLRWPGFLNHKYQPPFRACLTRYAAPLYSPIDFAAFMHNPRNQVRTKSHASSRPRAHAVSQSERDWAWTLDELRHGRSPCSIADELAQRRSDKPAPLSYASRTVSRALEEHARRAQR